MFTGHERFGTRCRSEVTFSPFHCALVIGANWGRRQGQGTYSKSVTPELVFLLSSQAAHPSAVNALCEHPGCACASLHTVHPQCPAVTGLLFVLRVPFWSFRISHWPILVIRPAASLQTGERLLSFRALQGRPCRRLVLCHLLGTSREATRWRPVRQGSGVPSSLPPGEHAQTLCSSARILLDSNTFNLNRVLFSYFLEKYNINTICHYSLRDTYYAGILICFTNLVVIMACECLGFKTLFAWSFESCL